MAQPQGYSIVQIILHWTIAALIVLQLVVNEGVQRAFDSRLDGEAMAPGGDALLHVVVGVTILVLAVIRLSIRLVRGAPPVHHDKPEFLNWLGLATHYLLYGFIFAMPLTGAIAWFGGVELSAELHELGRLVLIPAIGLHVLGALAEHFVFKNNSLLRMLNPDRG
jgi:cytochrome b561